MTLLLHLLTLGCEGSVPDSRDGRRIVFGAASSPSESPANSEHRSVGAPSHSKTFPLYWRVKVIRPEWHGRRCRIVIHGHKGNRLIEFDNGDRVVCPGAYLRRAA